jgi:hypothetical protein
MPALMTPLAILIELGGGLALLPGLPGLAACHRAGAELW